MSFTTEVDLSQFIKARKLLGIIKIQIDGDLTANNVLVIGERILELARDAIAFKTGAARESLQLIFDPVAKKVTVGSDGGIGPDGVRRQYLKYLEFGTSFMRAQPFLFPSAVIALNEFRSNYPLKIKELARIHVS